MKTSTFTYGDLGRKGFVKKSVLDLVQREYERGKRQFTYTEIHDMILDVVCPHWRNTILTLEQMRHQYRGQHTGMFSYQGYSAYQEGGLYHKKNVLCNPNRWDGRYLVKVKRGLYEFAQN